MIECRNHGLVIESNGVEKYLLTEGFCKIHVKAPLFSFQIPLRSGRLNSTYFSTNFSKIRSAKETIVALESSRKR